MNDNELNILFFICDISGYTAFMIKNQTDYVHGTLIIKRLLDALIKEINLPMKISKIEGDAIFFYFDREKMPQEYKDAPALLGGKMLCFFNVFYSKLQELQNSADCQCGACSNIDKLDLKMIIHCGKASIVQIGSFEELSGVDVIIAHRLLKNKVKGHCYLLITEPAGSHLHFPQLKCEQSKEEIDDVGSIPVSVFFPVSNQAGSEKVKPSRFTLAKTHCQLFLGELLYKLHLRKMPQFRNLPAPKDQTG